MVRFMMLAVAFLVLAGASNARGQDTEEVKRLREKVELLEAKLKLAEREVRDLKAELERVGPGGEKAAPRAADVMTERSEWEGKFGQEWVKDGGKVGKSSTAAKVVITARAENTFQANLTLDSLGVLEVSGTIAKDGTVKWGVDRVVEGKTFSKDLVGGLIGSGTLKGKKASLKFSIKGTTNKGALELELK